MHVWCIHIKMAEQAMNRCSLEGLVVPCCLFHVLLLCLLK